MTSSKEIIKVLDILKKTHDKTMLEKFHSCSPFQLLIMTLLSARTKDATVIPIALKLFKDYPGPEELSQISVGLLERKLYGVGFYRVKSKNVINLSKILLNYFNGKVPKTLDKLTSLPGVGVKTANCVLAYAFGIPAIAVDIHVHRITNSGRLAWVDTKTPEETEVKLKKLVSKERWIDVNKLIVDHGQRICAPVRPKCSECPVDKYCNFDELQD